MNKDEIDIKANEIEYKPWSTTHQYSGVGAPYDNVARYLDHLSNEIMQLSTEFRDLQHKFDTLQGQQNKEIEMRRNNPFIEELYMQYQAALKLADDQISENDK